jgi:MFS family permease
LFLFFCYSGLVGIMAMLKPYLVDLGYNVKEIGWMAGIYGTGIALFAAILAGYIVKKSGYSRSLVIFLGVSLVAGIYFYLLSLKENPSDLGLYAGITLLWLAYGSTMVAVYTAAMDMVRKGREGTDFTLQIVITHLSGLLIGVFSGKFADVFGYSKLFLVEAILSLFALILLFIISISLRNMRISADLDGEKL